MDNFLVIAGWFTAGLIGILASSITSRVTRKYQRGDMTIVIKSELGSLISKTAGGALRIDTHVGADEKTNFETRRSLLNQYGSHFYQPMLERLNEIDFETYQALLKPSSKYLALKKFNLPYIQSVLSNISVFNSEQQKGLLLIWDRVEILNEEISASMEFAHQTFDSSLIPENHKIVQHNLD